MRNGVFLGVLVVLAMVGTSLADEQIRFKSRQFVPQPGITAALMSKIEASPGGRGHIIIQLDRKMTRTYSRKLEEQGVWLLGFIPDRAWFAAVDSAKTGDIGKIAGIRAVCEILPGDKIAPSIRRFGINDVSLVQPGMAKLLVMFFEDVPMEEAKGLIAGCGGRVVGETRLLHGLIVHLKIDDIWDLPGEDCVKWIEQHYEVSLCNDRARSAVRANTVQEAPYGLTGQGVVVGIWDAGPIAAVDHNDLKERVIDANFQGMIIGHAIGVAGTLMGDGNDNSMWKGMAPKAKAVAYEAFPNEKDASKVEHDYRVSIGDYNIDVSNNSWGRMYINWPSDRNYDLDSTYDWDGAFYDEIVLGGCWKKISVFFSNGNEANEPGHTSWQTLRPNAVAKNVIAVGASNSWDDSVAPFSGRGPTADGRIKPDLVAPGIDGSCTKPGYSAYSNRPCGTDPNQYIWTCWYKEGDPNRYAGMNGTSMAAPVVSGCIALMLEQWRTNYDDPNYLPLPSTIKAVLIQTATDLTGANDPCCSAGPDYSSGYGLVDVKA